MAALAPDPIAEELGSRANRWSIFLGALAIVAITLLFFFAYFNRFAGLRSGDGSFSACTAWLAGKLPYRDYFLTSTPLNVIKSAGVLALFGDRLIVLRAFAMMERSLL